MQPESRDPAGGTLCPIDRALDAPPGAAEGKTARGAARSRRELGDRGEDGEHATLPEASAAASCSGRWARGAGVEVFFVFVVGMIVSLRTAGSGRAFGIHVRPRLGTELLFHRLCALTGPASSAQGPGAVGDPKGGVEAPSELRPSSSANGVGQLGVFVRVALLHVRGQGSQPARSGRSQGQVIGTSLEVLRAAGERLPVRATVSRCSFASAVSARACVDSPSAEAKPSLVGS